MKTASSQYLTVWGNPNEQLVSQYGRLTYAQWCERESERIGNGAFVKTQSDGQVCVFKP